MDGNYRVAMGMTASMVRRIIQQQDGAVLRVLLLSLLLLHTLRAPKDRIQVRNCSVLLLSRQHPAFLPLTSLPWGRGEQTGKQHRIIDEDGNLLDLLYP